MLIRTTSVSSKLSHCTSVVYFCLILALFASSTHSVSPSSPSSSPSSSSTAAPSTLTSTPSPTITPVIVTTTSTPQPQPLTNESTTTEPIVASKTVLLSTSVTSPTPTTTTTPAPTTQSSPKSAPISTESPNEILAVELNTESQIVEGDVTDKGLFDESLELTNQTTVSPNDLIIDDGAQSIPKRVISDIMPDEIRENGGIIVHILLLVYVSLSLGIICDVYFLTSIELIGEKLQLPPDIAGATFMALGTSAPELFVGLIGVFITQDDIGTSTILGSAVFNMIFVPSVCGFAIYFSGMNKPKISKYSILRDAVYYMIAITVVLLVMKDNKIDWVESLCMLLVFAVYLTILYFIAQLGELEILDEGDETSETESNETSPLLSKNQSFLKSSSVKLDGSQTHLDLEKSGVEKSRERRSSSVRPRFLSMNDDCESNVEGWVESNRFMKILMFPALICFRLTVPKPQKYSCSYLFTFMISIIWISFFTYAAVWLVDIIGYTFRLPQTVVGLTILAAGSSIPEVISSVLVVKRGLANMALCNLFGSNIFDILVCLGLPWLIKSIMNMAESGTMALDETFVEVHSNGLLLTILTLLVSVIAYLITLSQSGWRLGLSVGISCLIIYFITITLATLYEIYLN